MAERSLLKYWGGSEEWLRKTWKQISEFHLGNSKEAKEKKGGKREERQIYKLEKKSENEKNGRLDRI